MYHPPIAGRAAHLSALILAALLCLLLAAPSFAQGKPGCPPAASMPTAETFAAAAAQAKDRGLLWRVSKDGHSSYLYGTMHVGKAEWMAPGPLMRGALARSDTIGLELDPLDEAVQREMAARMAARAPVKLPAALQERLRKAWDAACLPPEALTKMPVEMQAVTITVMADRRSGLESAYGSEILLSMMGHGSGRAVVSLESVEQQLGALLAKNDEEAIEMVRGVLDEMDSGRTSGVLARSIKAWDTGDLIDFSRYFEWCECGKTASERDMMARLLDGRNPGLAARIDAAHAEGKRLFAAVGALHMIGPNGLPRLMAEKGYEVQRLR
jgi:uncharacterized protein YbaP (TraB family)